MENIKTSGVPTKTETKEGGPKIEVKIFFSAHVEAKNALAFQKDLEECDIFIPEFAGWDENDEKLWNLLSNGKIKPEEFEESISTSVFKEFFSKQAEML